MNFVGNTGWLHDVSNPAFDGEHVPVQSELYINNKERIKEINDILYVAIIVLFGIVVLLGSWKNLEEGKFPFNINFIADIAYANNKAGTPFIALVMVFFVGMIMYFGRIALLQVTETGLFNAVKDQLEKAGQLRVVHPVAPKTVAKTTQSGKMD